MQKSRRTDAALGTSNDVTFQTKRRRVERTNTCHLWKQSIAHFVDSSIAAAAAMRETTRTTMVDMMNHPPGIHGELSREEIVFNTYCVLRACWLFRGDPGDTFEPVRSMHAITRKLLMEYGGYQLTSDAQHLVINNETNMGRVGFLLFVLHELLIDYGGGNSNSTVQSEQFTGETTEWCMATVIGRVDNGMSGGTEIRSNGLESLHNSSTFFFFTQELLRNVVRAASPRVILLGNTTLTVNDVHALAERSLHADCFTTPHCNGHNMACFIPSNRTDACLTGTTTTTGRRGIIMGDVNFENCLKRAVSCGSRRTRHVMVHAILLSPIGPLLIHAEWYHHHYSNNNNINSNGDNGNNNNNHINNHNNNSGSVCDTDDEGLRMWLGELLQAPQPTVIIQSGHTSVISTETAMCENTLFPLPVHITTSASTTNTTINDNTVITVTVTTAAVSVSLDRELEVPVGCQVWRVKMLPHM
ncbi:hypothetical protein LSM04_007763 [Trypanosoma melophagium]|uniref:uncharacterized protein n=1 Tax=Trypanosoma melophagium TaxID=715481 RepID=UPI00351A3A30|nr:hypothetical protein LSM04_007763 [Trypanosoma melophagium]